MKFANYVYNGKNMNNLGDQIQILTIDYIYHMMGVKKEDIVYIDMEELPYYSGCPVILPVSMPLVNYFEHGIAGMFSPKITPVFLGLTLVKESLLPEEVSYYKRHEPVGCRDERTYHTLRRYGIYAYLGGCITVVLPERNVAPKEDGKIFLIDSPKGLRDYIPKEIVEKGEVGTHLFYGRFENSREMAITRYKQYAQEATLVITALLHCAVPCMAMGIPVILAKDVVSYRFGWLEALQHIYTPGEYDKIDWNPKVIDYKHHKERMRLFIEKRLYGSQTVEEIDAVHQFYMNRDRNEYVLDCFLPLKDFIDQTWQDAQAPYRYAVWGLTQMAELTVDYIGKRYPNAKLCHVYDTAHRYYLNGIMAEHPENIKYHPEETIFVTTVSAYNPAKEFFKSLNRPKNSYALLHPVV